MYGFRGFVLQVETVGDFIEYCVRKGPSIFLAGHTRVDSETEQQVIARLKARINSGESLLRPETRPPQFDGRTEGRAK